LRSDNRENCGENNIPSKAQDVSLDKDVWALSSCTHKLLSAQRKGHQCPLN